MAALLDTRGRAHCDCCDYALTGLPARGPCPECGRWYWLALAQPPARPVEWTTAYLRYWAKRAWDARPSLRSIAITLLILTISVITASTGWAAFLALLRKVGKI